MRGSIDTSRGILVTGAPRGNAGSITIEAFGDIRTAALSAAAALITADGITDGTGNNISLTSTTGSITVESPQGIGFLVTHGRQRSGDITLTAAGNITTGVDQFQFFPFTNPALPEFEPEPDSIFALDTRGFRDGQSGAIRLISQEGAINTSAGTLYSGSLRVDGGNITLIGRTSITTGNLISSSTVGKGGDIFIDPIGDVQVGSINTQGGTFGGNVDITAGRFFRAVGLFSDRNNQLTSISTAGGLGGGNIIIRHGGGALKVPFIVGDASINGTAGAISSGGFTIFPRQSFLGSYTLGNIQLLTTNPPLPLPTPTPLTPQPPILPPPDFELTLPPRPTPKTPSSPDEPGSLDPGVKGTDDRLTQQFSDYIASNTDGTTQTAESSNLPLLEIQDRLRKIEQATGVKPALIYAVFVPSVRRQLQQLQPSTTTPSPSQQVPEIAPGSGSKMKELAPASQPSTPPICRMAQRLTAQPNSPLEQDDDELELYLVTSSGKLLRKPVFGTNRAQILARVKAFREELASAGALPLKTNAYLTDAQQFYSWLIKPLETELKDRKINNLVFLLDTGLRSLPVAALHNGKEFIVQHYSLGLMPSLSLTDTRYANINQTEVLAMGASTFKEQNPLPAAEAEARAVADQLWKGQAFVNEAFTLDNLRKQRQQKPFGIIHLATHANFDPESNPDMKSPDTRSYIQLWDTKIQLNQIRDLGWGNPTAELVVLSACRTAIGNEKAELGFAGFAVLSGVKSALASPWYVSDGGTLGMMTEFYQRLRTTKVKAEALQQAQIAMIRGDVRLQNGKLVWTGGTLAIPPELQKLGDRDLSHPYYWSGFTLVGSPW